MVTGGKLQIWDSPLARIMRLSVVNNTYTLQNNTSDMVSNPEENSFVGSNATQTSGETLT